ncbi:MAG: hypothetical protein OXG88_07585 [Gammaproteobacteria bacterium]|nr:hypothetical protein [Gammaproteobacteria bacterium]
MKVHFFKYKFSDVHRSIKRVLQQIGKVDLAERERNVSNIPHVAEHISLQGEFYETDFTLRRETGGPSLARRGQKTKDLLQTLQEHEGFGEQTAAIWSKDGYAAIQYNHYGPKSTAIGSYINNFLDHGVRIELHPFIDEDVFQRCLSAHQHLQLDFTVNARQLTPNMANSNTSLEQALHLYRTTGGSQCTFSISYGKGKRGESLNFEELVKSLSKNRKALTRLNVKVREQEGGPTEVLHILNQLEYDNISDEVLEKTGNGKYERNSVRRELRHAFEKWLHLH